MHQRTAIQTQKGIDLQRVRLRTIPSLIGFLLCLLGCFRPAAILAQVMVTNTNSSGNGSLAAAINTVNGSSSPANTIDFAANLSGQTIGMGSTRLSLGGSTPSAVTIQNSLATSGVTVATTSAGLYGELLLVSNNTPLTLGGAGGQYPLTLHATASGNGPYYLLSSNGSLTLGSIGPTATLYLNLNNGLGLSKAVGVSASSNFLTISDGIQGTIRVSDATNGQSLAMGLATFGNSGPNSNMTVNGGISGTITVSGSAGSAEGAQSSAYGLYVPEGTLTLTGGLSGTVNATMTASYAMDANNAYGLYSGQAMSLAGGLSGAVNATAQATQSDNPTSASAFGLYSASTLSLDSLSGSVKATASNSGSSSHNAQGPAAAYGLYSAGAMTISGGISGIVDATAQATTNGRATAYGLYAGGTLNGGTPSTPVDISGSITATANGTAVGVYSAQTANLYVTGSINGVDTASSNGYALQLGRASSVTLNPGANAGLTGTVDLGGGGSLLTLLGTGSATSTFQNVSSLVAGDGSTLTNWSLDPSASSTFGSLTLTPNASLTNNNGNMLVSGAIVDNGRLTVPNLLLSSASSLSGSGTVVGNVTNAGTVAPESLTIQGDYRQNPGGVTVANLSAAGNSQLTVSGRTTINGGTLRLAVNPGYYTSGQVYHFLTSQGGITGTYDTVTPTILSPFLHFTASQDSPTSHAVTVTRDHYGLAATNRNALGAALGLDAAALSGSPAMASVITALDFSSSATASQALNQLSPEPYSALNETGLANLRLFAGTIRDRLYALRGGATTPQAESSWLDSGRLPQLASNSGLAAGDPIGSDSASASGRDVGFFLKPVGQVQTFDASTNRTGFQASTFGLVGGGDARLNENVILGAQIGYAHSELTFFDAAGSQAKADYVNGGLYGSFFTGGFHADALIQAGWAANHMQRRIAFASIRRTPTADATAFDWGSSFATGYDYTFDQVTIGPVATVDYGFLANPGFTESGASDLGLKVRANTANSLKSGLGLKASARYAIKDNLVIHPDVSLRWGHEFLDNSQTLTASFNGAPDARFSARTGNPARDDLLVDCGLSLDIKGPAKLFVRYSGAFFGEKTQTQAGAAGFRFEF